MHKGIRRRPEGSGRRSCSRVPGRRRPPLPPPHRRTPPVARRPGYTARVTNPWFPVLAGMRWVYRGREGGGRAREVARVARRTQTIDGAPCAVLLDRLYRNGHLAERTTDWYPRTRVAGCTTSARRRPCSTGTAASRAGRGPGGPAGTVPGAASSCPRIRASGAPSSRSTPRPRHWTTSRSSAAVRPSVCRTAPSGGAALLTKETTPIEPGVQDRKLYVRHIGQVVEATVKGGNDLLRLVAFRRH